MVHKIDLDHGRFKHIVRGAIRRDLKKHIANGAMIARQGSKKVTIPMPQIQLPRFIFGNNSGGGVGQGDGEAGEPLPGDPQEGGPGEAGDVAGEHELEVEVSLDELAQILGEELELPRIEPRGQRQVTAQVNRYTGLRRVGPSSLRHVRRTFKRALKREIASGRFGHRGGMIVPIRDDMRFRAWDPRLIPQSNAVIIYMMDVSGSMGDEQKEMVRIEAFWIDTWLKSQYKNIVTRYIVHDAEAKEVDQHTFFHLRESGGTKISSAYELCDHIIERDYPPDEWNIYPFHFSDGDNWSGGDTARCLDLLRARMLPKVNVFCYGQVRSTYGSGQFKNDLDGTFGDDESVITSDIPDRDGIMASIKDFLGDRKMSLPPEIADQQARIRRVAAGYGLDFFETVFEMVDWDEMNQIASYEGFPVRYPHWRWGMHYDQITKSYQWGLSKIYELVINNDPCYAYLLRGNSMVDQKLVMAHVYAHCDFFKNNLWFAPTNRRMVDELASHASRIQRHIDQEGYDEVETFLDSCLSLENLVDIYAQYAPPKRSDDVEEEKSTRQVVRFEAKSYMESFINPPEFIEEQRKQIEEERRKAPNFPERPERDVLWFLIEHAPLRSWQRDVLAMVREEAYYFAPQRLTKVMNEGWASYWHSTMMTEKLLEPSEIIDFAERHAGAMVMQSEKVNPYKLGIELYRDIEERWNKGRFGKEYDECDDLDAKRAWDTGLGEGRRKIFEVRKIYNDMTFVDEFLTPGFCERQKLFTYDFNPKTGKREISSRDFGEIKERLLGTLANGGQPIIEVADGNFRNRGEIVLQHRHDGEDLKLDWAKQTLEHLHHLWTRPVHLETVLEGEPRRFSYDGSAHEVTDL